MARVKTRPANKKQFVHRKLRVRWPKAAVLERIVDFNADLFVTLDALVGADLACRIIVSAIQGRRW